MMPDVYDKFIRTLKESVSGCTSRNIALSGGLDSSVIGYLIRDRSPDAYVVISEDFIAHDLTYSQMIASRLDIALTMIKADAERMASAIEKTIKILGNFNDIEVRNSLVMYIVLDEIRQRGQDSIITGDGADELFAGYDFLLKKSDAETELDLDRISKIMHFPSKKIGQSLGVRVETPFLSNGMQEFAKSLPLEYKVRMRDGVKLGKWVIRKAFEDKIPPQIAWRKKAPMQDGAGTAALTNLFDVFVTDEIFEEQKKQIKLQDGIHIRTKESLHYYKMFRKHFDPPKPDEMHACPDCRYKIAAGSRFCRMCGRFPV